ncbi:hypothetical protein OAE36_02205 [bacterium]|nr:hypothetical protein [bacterium]
MSTKLKLTKTNATSKERRIYDLSIEEGKTIKYRKKGRHYQMKKYTVKKRKGILEGVTERKVEVSGIMK